MKIYYTLLFSAITFFANAQSYSFENYCGWVDGAACTSCTGGFSAEYFNGLILKKSGKNFARLPAGWYAKQMGETITFYSGASYYAIPRGQTNFLTMFAFRGAIDQLCATGAQVLSVNGNQLTIGPNGNTVMLPSINTAITNLVSAGNLIGTYTNEAGAPYQIRENITAFGLTGSNFSFKNESGAISNVPISSLISASSNNSITTGTDGKLFAQIVDQSISNEGVLSVGAGGPNSTILNSNTSTSAPISLLGGAGVSISEMASANGGAITFELSANELLFSFDQTSAPVAIGKPFLAANPNGMGMAAGTLIFRQY